MTLELATILFFLGLTGGFFSGWLGIGGGIIMAPLLLYVPSSLGAGNIDMKTVAGLTMLQSLFASGSGVLVHRRFRHVSRRLVLWMGGSITAASLAGALLSRYVAADLLLSLFVSLAFVAAIMMFIPHREPAVEPDASDVGCNQWLALGCGVVLGLVGGLVGQSGAFIIIPVMIYILRVPTRTAIGSSLGIVLLSAAGGSVGKAVTGQIEWKMALFLVGGALIGAQAGGMLSHLTARRRLRRALAVLIAITAIGMTIDLVG